MTAPFRPRFPWWGGDLQTLRNKFVYRHKALPGEAVDFRVLLPDGDTLTGTLHEPLQPTPQPFIVLLHGLTGSENSMYMLESTRYHLSRGRGVLRMNLRRAGSSEDLCKTPYSGKSWPDVLAVLGALDPKLTQQGIFVIGYSMGGNILLNGLPHFPADAGCIGAATVSAPIDPVSASRRLMEWRNRPYQNELLKEMQESHLALEIAQYPAMRRAIESADSIWAFDDQVTAQRLGFGSAEAYYEGTAGKHQIGEARVPLLLIHSRDDPWIPVAPYLTLSPPAHVTVEITKSGGHVGYHGRDSEQPWHDLRISDFIDGIAGLTASSDLPSGSETVEPI